MMGNKFLAYLKSFARTLGEAADRIGFKKRYQWSLISQFIPPLHDLPGSRIVEYAWVLRNLNLDKGTILDVGPGYSKFPILLASCGFKVYAIDIRDYPHTHPNLMFIKGDIRDDKITSLYNVRFDAITCISTLEHIGLNDDVDDGDIKAIGRMRNLLKPQGRLLLTIPFSDKYVIKDGERKYDEERIKKITKGFIIEKIEFFSSKSGYYMPSCSADADLVCLTLLKK